MLPWLGEVAIENLLLIGRQNSANVAHSLPEHLMPAMHIVLPRLHHFEPGIAQDIRDSIALRRRQIELTIHSLDQPASGHVQVVIPVRHRAQRETNQKARGSNQEAEPDIRPSWQDRSLSLASPVPTGRLLFRKSCSTRVPKTRHLRDSLGVRVERYAALVANTNIAAAAAIGSHRFGRDASRDADANRAGLSASENSRRAGRDTCEARCSISPCRTGAVSAKTRNAWSHFSHPFRCASSSPRRSAVAVLRHSAGNSCRASKQFITVTCCDPLRASAQPACAAPVARGMRESLPWPHSTPASRRFR